MRLQYYIERLDGCESFWSWSVHGLRGLLGFALPPSCRCVVLTLRTVEYLTTYSVLYLKGHMCAAHLCAWLGVANSRKGKEKSTGFLFRVMVYLLSVWVCLLSMRAGQH